MIDITIVSPLLNEAESLPELARQIKSVANKERLSYEIIFVDDGSTDDSWDVIRKLSIEDPNIKGIKFSRNYGKSAALNEGFKMAQGDIVITMDADLQDNPDEIPELVSMIRNDGFHMVSGWKKKRYDNALTKNLPSKFFNSVTRQMSGIHLHDFNCGLKAYHHKVIKSIEVYGEMHRYIPVLAKNAGFKKIGEKVVKHQARKYGTSKFGWDRFINGFLDLMTVQFIGKFGKRPMHFFGLIGFALFMVGFLFLGYVTIMKFIEEEYFVTNRPFFFIALTAMTIGSTFFLAGYLAELIVRNAPERNDYLIEERLGSVS